MGTKKPVEMSGGKEAEINYYKAISPQDLELEMQKPFSDPDCSRYLIEMGAVMRLLPEPPARLLDLGCGIGWTSRFFAKRGYAVTAVDISPYAIRQAHKVTAKEGLRTVEFVVGDYENLTFDNEFNCTVFFESLHHAANQEAAIAAAYKSLKRGGVCVIAEPGKGHEFDPTSIERIRKYGVNERGAPPRLVAEAAKEAGFRFFKVYPHAGTVAKLVYGGATSPYLKFRERVRFLKPLIDIGYFAALGAGKQRDGILVLVK